MEASPNETQLEGQPLPEDDVGHLLELAEGLLVLGQDVVGVGAADALAKISRIIKKNVILIDIFIFKYNDEVS
jgi:hypothetical protein